MLCFFLLFRCSATSAFFAARSPVVSARTRMHASFHFDSSAVVFPRHSISRRVRTKAQLPSTAAVTHSLSFAVPAMLRMPIMICMSLSPISRPVFPYLILVFFSHQARTHVRGFSSRHTGKTLIFDFFFFTVCISIFPFSSGRRTLHRPCGELTDVHLRLAETAPAALVAAAAVIAATETETVIARGTATATEEIVIVSGMIAIVGIGIIKIAEIGTAIIERRKRRTIVAAGALTASAACRRSPSRKMMFLGLRLQSERVKVLACLPSVWIRTKNRFVACLIAVSLLPLNFGSVLSPKKSNVPLLRCWPL